MKLRRLTAQGSLLLAATSILFGCAQSHQEEATSHPWEEEFQRIYAQTESDLVRAIVADGVLTLAEMREAAEATLACLRFVEQDFAHIEEVRFDIEETGDGGFRAGMEHISPFLEIDRELMDAASECELRYWNDLWILWDNIRVNPEAEDFDDLVHDCLVRNSVIPPNMTMQNFREATLAGVFHFDYDIHGSLSEEELIALWEAHEEQFADWRPQLSDGTYLDEGLAWDCQMDPLNH